jgi:tetratricopeptide (TPR) repeat protein
MIDPYASCPCGSGKKFKWCCVAIHEQIEKALEQHRNGQHEMALHTIEEVIKAHPRNPEPWGRKAQLLHASGHIEEAEKALDQAFQLNPAYPFGFLLRGIFREDEGEREGAAMLYRKAAEVYAPDAHQQLAFLYERIGLYELNRNNFLAARYAFQNCLRLMPENQDLREVFDETFGPSSPAPAIARSDLRLLGYEPKRPPEWNEAISKGNAGKLSEAVKYFESLVKQPKVDPLANYNAGLLRAWLGDNAKALEHWDRYVEKEKDEAKTLPVVVLMQVLLLGEEHLDKADFANYRFAARVRDPRRVGRVIEELMREGRYLPIHRNPDEGTITGFLLMPSTGLIGAAAPVALPVAAMMTLVRDGIHLASPQFENLEKVVSEIRATLAEAIEPVFDTPQRTPARFSDIVMESMVLPTYGKSHPGFTEKAIEHLTQYFEGRWLDRSFQFLSGLSPRQAAEQPTLRRRLLGLILFYEQIHSPPSKASAESATATPKAYDFQQLRKLLHLDGPPPPAIDFSQMTVSDLAELNTESLSSDQLEKAFRMAVQLDAPRLARKFIDAILARPADPHRPDLYPFYKYLIDQAQTQADWDKALQIVEEGLKADAERNQGQRRNDYEVRRGQLLAKKGDVAKAAEAFQTLIDRVPNEPKFRGTAAEAMLSLRQGQRALEFAQGGLEVAQKVGNRDLEAYFKELVTAARKFV